MTTSPLRFREKCPPGRGGNKKRAQRQQEAAKAISEYIHSDVAHGELGSRMRVAAREAICHHGDAITRLAKNLPRQGWIAEEIETGLQYFLIDCGIDKENLPDVLAPLAERKRVWALLSVNDQKKVVQGYYPFPLLIRDAEVLFRFYNGEFIAFVAVDISYVNEVILSNGIKIEFADDLWRIARLVPEDHWGERYVTLRAIHLLAAEFLSLRWFINNILIGEMQDAMTRIMAEQKLCLAGLT